MVQLFYTLRNQPVQSGKVTGSSPGCAELTDRRRYSFERRERNAQDLCYALGILMSACKAFSVKIIKAEGICFTHIPCAGPHILCGNALNSFIEHPVKSKLFW